MDGKEEYIVEGHFMAFRIPSQRLMNIDLAGVVPVVVIGLGLLAATGITYATGGTHRAFPHLYYIPIIVAAYFYGIRGGLTVGAMATLACGPLMPIDSSTGELQTINNWATRGVFFIAIGAISGVGAQTLRDRLHRTQQLHEDAIRAFVKTIDAKSPYTARHSERVADFAVAAGRAMNLSHYEIERLRWSALLHDVGKLWIPDELLNKRGPLSEAEWERIRQHPVDSEAFIASISEFQCYGAAARNHHERFDGRGYPDGLAGEEIPLDARIIAVADAFEAMTSDRPYRPGLTVDEARRELNANAGSQFDPLVVTAMQRAVSSEPETPSAWSDEVPAASPYAHTG